MFGRKEVSRKQPTPESLRKSMLKCLERKGLQYGIDGEDITAKANDQFGYLINIYDQHVDIMGILTGFKVSKAQRDQFIWKMNLINVNLSFGRFSVNPDGIVFYSYGHVCMDSSPSVALFEAMLGLMEDLIMAEYPELKAMAERNDVAERDPGYA